MADTYTIQFRRGMYADFDTSKIRPGEPVAILGNDPSVPSGKALYIAFAANDVRRLCSIEDITEMVNAGEFVGPQGPKGEKGDKGADGTVAFELLTPEQKESLRGISIKSASVDTDGNLTITFSDGDSEDVGNIMGPQGIPGPKGDKGDVGPQGPKGDKGDVGPKGDNMSDEQAAQIEQNKKDVASLKEDLSTKITKFYASSQGETHLADSGNGKIMDMMVYGKSEQKQYSGKNLLNATLQTTTRNGVTCTANGDGTYTLNGTATDIAIFVVYYNFADVYGSASSLKMVGCPSGGSAQKYFLRSYRKGGNPEILDEYGSGISIGSFKEVESNIAILVKSGVTVNNLIFKPMLTTDTTATYADFEPYTGGIPSPNPDYPQEIKSVVNPKVVVRGKNLLNPTLQTTTNNGITCTNNGDGTYTLNGKLSSNTIFTLFSGSLSIDNKSKIILMKNDTFADSGIVAGYCAFKISSSWDDAINYPTIKEIPSGKIVQTIDLVLRLSNGGAPVTLTNVLIKPMIVDASLYPDATYDDFEPYHEQTVTLPYTLNAIPVNSGGNVTIDGQQYIADYVDVERGKLVRMVANNRLLSSYNWNTANEYYWGSVSAATNGKTPITADNSKKMCACKYLFASSTYDVRAKKSGIAINNIKQVVIGLNYFASVDDLKTFLANNDVRLVYPLEVPTEIDLTSEEIAAFKALATYYPTTNISVNSEQLDGYTVFNYPISMANGWNYVKQQLNDNRDYIYDMDLQSAEAYVNSEYAVALTELEV